MSAEIAVPPDLWTDATPGAVSAWLYQDGDDIADGSIVAEVMNGKVTYEITAPAAGKLVIEVPAESEIALGQRIGRVESS
jgi:pyruvate/2-oxoglutarate dehydrogenase complex dihydrolipoamide acyltransferase (E2) component